MKQFTGLVGGLILCGLLAISHASLQQGVFDNSPAGVAGLECLSEVTSTRTVSLGVVLETHVPSIPDLVLVTAHGITTPIEDCSVSFKGQNIGIASIEKGTGPALRGDWAVLTLEGRFKRRMQRLEWYVDGADQWADFAARGGEVKFIKVSNGLPGKPCTIGIPSDGMVDSSDGQSVLISDCVSIPGMSGAPALVQVDGQPAIIGFNVAMRYDLANPARASVIRLVDRTIEAAIIRAIAAGTKF